MTVYLNDYLVDLDKPVILKYKNRELVSTEVYRDRLVIQKTLRDPKDYYTAEINFELPN